MSVIRGSSLTPLIAGVLLVAAGLGFSAGSRTAEAAPRPTMQALVEAWNAGDAGAFLNHVTESGITQLFPVESLEQAEEELPSIIGDPQLQLLSVANITGTAGGSSATVELGFGVMVWRADASFVLQDGSWRLDSWQLVDAAPGASGAPAEVSLQEYAFVYDEDDLASGNFILDVTNVGEQAHEIVLFRLNTTEPLLDLVQSEGEPEGLEFLGVAFWEPGEARSVALSQPLGAGRYAMLCFFPDPDGVPHVALGMFTEFNVGEPAITPPATGSAGLASGSGAWWPPVLVLAGALVLALGLARAAVLRPTA